jgi:hypothetical protein
MEFNGEIYGIFPIIRRYLIINGADKRNIPCCQLK